MSESAGKPRRFDVAIIGYGPVGATLANLLGQAGLRVAVFEREASVYPLPRAAHFDGEVMRIFQSIGLKAEIAASSRAGLKGMHFVNGAGKTLLIRTGSTMDGPHGCANNYYFHQPDLEAALRRGAQRFGNVEVFLRHEVFALAPEPDRVMLRVENMANGSLDAVEASYVVGCDGARSLTRRMMGSLNEDLGLHQPWLVLDVILKRAVDLPDHSVQICDPQRPMTYVNMVGDRRRWEVMLMPGDDATSIARPERVWEMLQPWLSEADATLERTAVYTFHSVLADGWRNGRLLLAGDACHQTPPFLGQGMCAGIRDAANLAWKLAMVVKGQARDDLLDTYESERKPHVRAFIELAVRLGGIIQTTDTAVAAERDRQFADGSPQLFNFPSPALGPGVHDDAPAPIGAVFPQPKLDDARLLDDITGVRFAVIGDAQLVNGVNASTRERWQRADAIVLAQPGAAASQWLAEHGARAVVLRPDRYVLGLAASAADLDRLGALLPLAA